MSRAPMGARSSCASPRKKIGNGDCPHFACPGFWGMSASCSSIPSVAIQPWPGSALSAREETFTLLMNLEDSSS